MSKLELTELEARKSNCLFFCGVCLLPVSFIALNIGCRDLGLVFFGVALLSGINGIVHGVAANWLEKAAEKESNRITPPIETNTLLKGK